MRIEVGARMQPREGTYLGGHTAHQCADIHKLLAFILIIARSGASGGERDSLTGDDRT